ncbi:MAG TPA: 3-dehydroquinate synthase [Fredinandcohnia sp.]|nr:3-dehydroquinate synthase [Fredinandcohnia sp.]
MERILVRSGAGAYPVLVGEGLLERLGELLEAEGIAGRFALFADEAVLALHGAAVRAALPDAAICTVPSGEAAKTLAWAERLWGFLIEGGFGRNDVAVALGGGATLDLVGFVAATYHRGMPVVHLPTTLLAQVDASVGGKTAIDHPLGKNLVGAFHPPRMVVADLATLRTLPARERWAGLAEVAKAALIADLDLLARLEADLEALAEGAPERLGPVVARAIAIKAEVVEQDERDHGLRQILNFGHTLGHALEAALGYRELLHGEAVVLGMRAAVHLSCALGHLTPEEVERARALLARFPLPRVEFPPASAVLSAARRDKKGPRAFVTIGPLGKARVERVGEDLLSRALETVYPC